jgi:hypothetical protein
MQGSKWMGMALVSGLCIIGSGWADWGEVEPVKGNAGRSGKAKETTGITKENAEIIDCWIDPEDKWFFKEPKPCDEDFDWWNKPFFCVMDCGEWWGEWLPEGRLFTPFIADPHQVTYSVGWRFDDQVLARNVIPVSYGDAIPFYRFYNVWPWCGQLQIELEGALWAVFDPLHESSPLINADYYIGVPISYALGPWQFRLRGFHISSHIGDEFLLNHPDFHRRNPSAEFLDFFVSHDLTDEIRIYAGIGYIIHQDNSFHCKPFYADIGGEIHLWSLGFSDSSQRVYGAPVFAMFARYRGDNRRHVDMTYALGYEFGKMCGNERKVRALIEYHDGYSVEGQFSHRATNYLQILLTYGF